MAFSLQRIYHAAWPCSVWLHLLLWSDVDAPPYRFLVADVLIRDILYDASSMVAWICLDVDRLQWMIKFDVPKGYVSHATVLVAWRY